jgi:hypothetical protein
VCILGKFQCVFSRRRFGAPEFTVHHNPTITPKGSTKKAQKGHSTHVIGAASAVKIAINSKKAEVLNNFSSYQTLTKDVNLQRYNARTKLVKKWTVTTVHSC